MTATFDRLSTALEGRYRVDRELGAGGMATVYLAHDLRHERDVAIKVLHPDLGAALGAERFLAEIKTTAKLQHPHILPLLDSGAADGLLFYVMPYVRGETLRTRLERERQLPIPEALRIAREVAGALEHAHKQGIIHRDIKPENILLQDGAAVVADFGIALAVQQAGGQRMTQTGLSLGTPQYMSPEQAMGEKAIDARSDIYALGAVTYEMLAGEPPFSGPSTQAIVAKVLSERPVPLTTLRDSVSTAVSDSIMQALSRTPADRQSSAAQFAEGLTRTGETSVLAGGPSRAPRRWPMVAAFALGAMLAAVSLTAVRTPPSAPVRRLRVELPETQSLTGDAGHRIALSPDGRTLAYLGAVNGRPMVMLRALDSTEAVPLPGTEGAGNVAFSPDGAQIAFTSGSPRGIRTMSIRGGTSVLLTDSLVDLGGVHWADDGYVYYDGHLEGDGIARIRATGGQPEIVTSVDRKGGEMWHLDPFVLPGSKLLLFQAATPDGPRIGLHDLVRHVSRSLGPGGRPTVVNDSHLLWVTLNGQLLAAPVDPKTLEKSGEPTVVAAGVGIGYLDRSDVVTNEAGLLAFVSGSANEGRAGFALVDRKGALIRFDSAGAGAVANYRVSADGRTLAWDLFEGTDRQVWTRSIGGGPAVRFSYEGRNNSAPFWLPDGRLGFIANSTDNSRTVSLMVAPLGGTAPTRVREFPDRRRFLAAPDGKGLVLWGGGIWYTSLDGDTTIRPIIDKPAVTELFPSVSPDGRWIAYHSNESGREEVYIRSFPDGARVVVQVTSAGGSEPAFSSDGRELFYVNARDELMSVPVTTGERFSFGEPTRLFAIERFGAVLRLWYDPLPDGQRFVLLRPLSGRTDTQRVNLVESFEALLRGSKSP